MSNKQKTYFLVPGWDYPVGSVTLGSVIEDPSQPQPTLFAPNATTIDTKIFPTDKQKFSQTIGHGRKGSFGLFAKFLSIFGIGVEASVDYNKSHVEKYSFEHMHTEWFNPSPKFINAAIADHEVASFVEQFDYEKPVYMVTGIKTVKGASVTTSKSRGRGWKAFFGLDGTPAGVPVSLGPKAEQQSTTSDEATFENSSDIVFAYRLERIKCGKDKTVSTSNHTVGALFGTDGESGQVVRKPDDGMMENVDVDVAYDEGDEEPCVCVLPENPNEED